MTIVYKCHTAFCWAVLCYAYTHRKEVWRMQGCFGNLKHFLKISCCYLSSFIRIFFSSFILLLFSASNAINCFHCTIVSDLFFACSALCLFSVGFYWNSTNFSMHSRDDVMSSITLIRIKCNSSCLKVSFFVFRIVFVFHNIKETNLTRAKSQIILYCFQFISF